MASAATAIDRHTLGRIRTTGAKMRSCQDDQWGGTDLINAQTAWRRCFSQYLDVRLKITWSTFISSLRAGRGAILVGWYSYIPRQYRGQDSANFGHAIYINEVRASDGALLMYDPLKNFPVWVPQIYIKRFAGNLRLRTGVLGYGYAQAGFTRDTEPAPGTTPPPPTTTVTLRYGGVRITPNLYEAKVAARQRRSPYIRTDNTIRTVKLGTDFKAWQRTNSGTNVGGSRVWYGNQYGNVWMHSSVLRDIKG
jgi:hypothetical protein